MPPTDAITIVSGLPRSGTSMMMSMLEAGGMTVLSDGVRTADEDNPKGYFEFERIKKLKEDKGWLPDARGKVVKGISELLKYLPTDGGYKYKIIFMRRNIDEILSSQTKMLKRRGTHDPSVKDEEIRRMFLVHLDRINDFLRLNDCFDVLYVNYNVMLKEPADRIAALNEFLGGDLDTAAMSAVIDKSLYRNRVQ
ncbi:MAG: sulfotransferase family protein [Phycisphaerales bacterium]|nr:sulfotransferase family protein [Phycisphaerales bacterium]